MRGVHKTDSQFVTVSPSDARWYLKEYLKPEHQRGVSHFHVGKLRSFMDRDEYLVGELCLAKVNGETRIANGMHSLMALAELDGSPEIPFCVWVFDCDDEEAYARLFSAFDTEARTRSWNQTTDRMVHAGVSELPTACVTKTRTAYEFLLTDGALESGVRERRTLSRTERTEEALGSLTDSDNRLLAMMWKSKFMPARRRGIMAAMLQTNSGSDAYEFWEIVCGQSDQPHAMDHPALTLREDLLTARQMRGGSQLVAAREMYGRALFAWNAYCQGRSLKIIRTPKDPMAVKCRKLARPRRLARV